MSITYLHLLLALTGALLFILAQFLLRRPWQLKATGIQSLLDQDSLAEQELELELDQEYLVPLVIYEEDYPAFGNIIRLVLESFPLGRFLEEEDFEEALVSLRNSVFQSSQPQELVSTMCMIVNTFFRDPDVEYRCRPHLEVLVNQFLEEVDISPDEL
jgi:hypothetical protein